MSVVTAHPLWVYGGNGVDLSNWTEQIECDSPVLLCNQRLNKNRLRRKRNEGAVINEYHLVVADNVLVVPKGPAKLWNNGQLVEIPAKAYAMVDFNVYSSERLFGREKLNLEAEVFYEGEGREIKRVLKGSGIYDLLGKRRITLERYVGNFEKIFMRECLEIDAETGKSHMSGGYTPDGIFVGGMEGVFVTEALRCLMADVISSYGFGGENSPYQNFSDFIEKEWEEDIRRWEEEDSNKFS